METPFMAQSSYHLSGSADPKALERGSVTFIGTATTLIKYGGFNILTDPNFLHAGQHMHVGFGMITKRLTDPSMDIEDLPPLDLCLLSHMHSDHWDRIASKKLRKDLPVFTTNAAAFSLRMKGFQNARGMKTWETAAVTKGGVWLRITSMPGRHGPGAMQLIMPPVMGSMLEWGTGRDDITYRMYISGDTLAIDELKDIPKRFPNIDLALIHLGGTRLFGVLVTMDAEQGIKAVRILRPKKAIPIHYNDYPLFKSPLDDFVKEVEKANLTDKIEYLAHGEIYDFAGNIAAMRRKAG